MRNGRAEITFAHALRTAFQVEAEGRVRRDIPAVDPGLPHPAIAARDQMAVQVKALHDVPDQRQARPPAGEIESGKHFDVVALDIDRHEIERLRRSRVFQHLVKRHDWDFDAAGAPHAGDIEIRIERGLDAGDIKRQRLAAVFRCRPGDRVDLGAPRTPQLLGQIGLRLDQQPCRSNAQDCDPSCGALRRHRQRSRSRCCGRSRLSAPPRRPPGKQRPRSVVRAVIS